MDDFLSTVNYCVEEESVKKYTFHSSLLSPFLVISEEQLVVNVPELGDEMASLTYSVAEYIRQLANRRAVVLADFEGEMPGFGGELVTACFQETLALGKDNLEPLQPQHQSPMMGLFIDLRHSVGINLCAQIMENANITKVIWGAEGDLTSLRFQYLPREMSIQSQNVVDAQLAFSSPGKRLGMSRMLAKVPNHVLSMLPSKDIIDFDQAHAYNQRALPLPFSHEAALYSVDDLHRLEAVLRTQRPPICFSFDGGFKGRENAGICWQFQRQHMRVLGTLSRAT
eukprot:GEMP01025833.1.p1 GENE.GEMP01025833.1~~GEMP01025833.1.p1  ORF type:complete len:283 (-),score=57.76 GEMP01025833.1:1225-2073(-)